MVQGRWAVTAEGDGGLCAFLLRRTDPEQSPALGWRQECPRKHEHPTESSGSREVTWG